MSLVFKPEEAAKQAKVVRDIHSALEVGTSRTNFHILKPILILLLSLGFLFAIILSTSADDMQADDEKAIEMIQGPWYEEFMTRGVRVVSNCIYDSDMTFTTDVALVFPEKGTVHSKLSGRWNVMADDLITEITETDNVKNFPIGWITAVAILTINDNMAFYRLDSGFGFQAYRPEYMDCIQKKGECY